MEKEFNKEEALSLISRLLDTINWLGGDADEMDAVEKISTDAQSFLAKHIIKEEKVEAEYKYECYRNGIYVLKEDSSKKVSAFNKKHAAKIMNVGIKNIKCVKRPWESELSNV
jgi:hypothetical protein